jgi:hypothetical protein
MIDSLWKRRSATRSVKTSTAAIAKANSSVIMGVNHALGCAVNAVDSGSHPIAGVDYGAVPLDYEQMVERHLKFEHDIEDESYGKEWIGPFEGSVDCGSNSGGFGLLEFSRPRC